MKCFYHSDQNLSEILKKMIGKKTIFFLSLNRIKSGNLLAFDSCLNFVLKVENNQNQIKDTEIGEGGDLFLIREKHTLFLKFK